MGLPEVHVLQTELIADRQTVRYSCPVCHRCLEDGPEGITIIHKGEQQVRHRGGGISTLQSEVGQEPPSKPVLH
jgi:hypothetical protein